MADAEDTLADVVCLIPGFLTGEQNVPDLKVFDIDMAVPEQS